MKKLAKTTVESEKKQGQESKKREKETITEGSAMKKRKTDEKPVYKSLGKDIEV